MSSDCVEKWGSSWRAAAQGYHGPAGHMIIMHGLEVCNHAVNDQFRKIVEVRTGVSAVTSMH